MKKRLMIIKRGYCEISGNMTDQEAIAYAKKYLSPADFNWETPMFDTLEVVSNDKDENSNQ